MKSGFLTTPWVSSSSFSSKIPSGNGYNIPITVSWGYQTQSLYHCCLFL
jgi:hypothetical protein